MATKTYTAKTPIDYNGTRYEEGASIDIEDEHAKPLLDVDAIAPAKQAASKTESTKK